MGQGASNEDIGQSTHDREQLRRRRSKSQSQRGVSFCDKISVVLIPSRNEYEELELTARLWWSSDEFMETKFAAESELMGALALEDGITSGEAVQLLYQPRCQAGHRIVHALVVSPDPKFRSHMFALLKKAHKKAEVENRLLVQQADSIEELLDKLDMCVDFGAIFLDRFLMRASASRPNDLIADIRSRHREACVVVVRPFYNSDGWRHDRADFYWSLDLNANFHNEWREVLALSDAYLTRPRRPSLDSDTPATPPEAPEDADETDDEFSSIPRSLAELSIVDEFAVLIVSRQPPFTITYHNDRWSALCGYSALDTLGRDIAFTKGVKTDVRKLASLKVAIETGCKFSTFLINYDAQGREFISYIRGLPLSEPDAYTCVFEPVDSRRLA